MTYEARGRALRELSAANNDYDTALHVVESIRRKALTASRAALSDHHRDLVIENESDSSEGEGENGTDYARGTSDVEENDEAGDSDDGEDDGDNNSSSKQARHDAFARLKLNNSARGSATHSHSQKALSTPAPPLKQQQQQRQQHDAPMNKHLEMLRIESVVELHRSSSGRNLRLKHISQVSKEALSPHVLTPRAPSGKRPTERPSSWSSSSSSSSSAVVHRFEDAKCSFQRHQPHRSISTGSSSSSIVLKPGIAVSSYSSTSTASSSFDEDREMELPSATASVAQLGRGTALAQHQSKLFNKKTTTNQNRRCSFTISELALNEMGFSRSTPGSDTAPISEGNQLSDNPFFAQAQRGGNEVVGVGQEEEKEEKVVYKFDLWKKAGKSRQLPDAISTRQAQQQQQTLQASDNQQKMQQQKDQVQRKGEQEQQDEIEKLKKGPWRRKQSIKDACEMVSILHMGHASKEEKVKSAFSSGSAGNRNKKSSDVRGADSSSLCLTRSRSPTISAARSSRSSASGSAYTSPSTLPPNSAITKWKRGELVGEGTFGKIFDRLHNDVGFVATQVYMGLNSITGELFAVKEIEVRSSPNIDDVKQLQKLGEEIEVMNNLNHKHIVRYKGSHRSDNSFYIFMEYVPGGSIASMLKQFDAFSEDLIKIFTRQIVEGVMYLHAMGVVHRDIKGANVLVNEQGVSKLADFGCSKQLPQLNAAQSSKITHHSPTKMHTASLEESLRSIRGSVPWMAPEVVKQTGHGFKADIWSIGATVIEMATARHPWPGATNSLFAMYVIATATSPPPLPEHLSKDALAFLQRCFCINPEVWLAGSYLKVLVDVGTETN